MATLTHRPTLHRRSERECVPAHTVLSGTAQECDHPMRRTNERWFEGSDLAERIWDQFLSPRDRARAAAQPALRKGGGQQPALLLVDLYREVFGDRPQPLLEALDEWP